MTKPPQSHETGPWCLKPGYRENEAPRSYDRAPDARYWTNERLAVTTAYQWPVYQLCRELLAAAGARSFLDVGCGPATKVAELIAPLCSDLVLIDQPSSQAIVARALPGAVFIGADLDALDLDLERTFDLIVCADVLEHLKHPDACMQFIRAHLARGGRAVLSTPERDHLRGPDCTSSPHPEHVREWNAAEFRAFATGCGFQVERQLLLPQLRLSALETLASRALGRRVLRRRWASCQALICRLPDPR